MTALVPSLDDNRLVKAFAQARENGKKLLLPFLTAGYPDLDTTVALLHELERRGCKACELGFPFSDPIADGPTIQTSYTQALSAGVTPPGIFEAVRRFRAEGGQLALVAMVSYSLVYRPGVGPWLEQAAGAGFDGLIIPDLPVEEVAAVEPIATKLGLANILLVAPTTPPQRRYQIAGHCTGFVYFVSVAGITGERDRLPEETIQGVADLRKHTQVPVCVGFGVSKPEMVATVCQVADGAIVGSAIVHRITDAKANGQAAVVSAVGDFVAQLLEPIA